MKIYTIQRRNFLTYTDSQGFIIPKRDPEYSIFTDDEEGENCLWALEWMKRQFIKRLDIPLDRDLIWVWPDIYAYLSEKSDIDFSRHALFTFEVPAAHYKKMILWSNFISWHEVLNRLWEGATDVGERYEEIFQLKRHEKPGTIQGITTRLHKDWIKRVT
ncbi:DUF3841 domain-containing protein [Enterococcus raffinosus]|uniref:DUF3841 domain-containing protein n=1 Tax=Enterococcus raffinosus TaxID=71452 RepID=UPI002890821E|nr:DUF3841 domain-containing protein [Enterococcus raffinosus]MDT2523292.1 DUF3841 domain-containing protein [Enterococcus raffinosus]MDT2534131.1 DUF3841 domain-containing protein [Enterococcus raffinosus]MDT2590608.1 DUF3841 domain-containing protein [Enterococcus raffinosus]